MINSVAITTPTVSTKIALVSGNFDDGVLVTSGIVQIDYTTLTAGQKVVFDDFVNTLLGTDKNVSIINIPYNSDFGIDYITDAVTFVDSQVEYDYTALSGTSKRYIDDFNALVLDLI